MVREPFRRAALVSAYVALMAGWIYGVLNPWPAEPVLIACAALVAGLHVALGYTIGRWWAFLAYYAAVLIAAPAGTPEVGGDPFPLWFGLVLYSPAAILLVLLGVGARTLHARTPAPMSGKS